MFAFVILMITLLTVPATVFHVFEEQDIRQDAATTITSEEDPCAIDPDEEDVPEDDIEDTPEDTENDTPDENDETDPPSEDNPEDSEDTDSDEDVDAPEEDVRTPRTKTPRVKDPERSYRKLAREIRKRVGAKKPEITVTVPTPRPPRIRMPEFPDWFPFKEEEREEDLGEQIRNKVRSNFEDEEGEEQDLGEQIRNKVRSNFEEDEEIDLAEEIRNKTRSRFNNNPTPTSFFAKKQEKEQEQRRVIQVPRTKAPVISQAAKPKSTTRKGVAKTIKDRFKNNRATRIQQVEDCITPDPEQPAEEPLENPATITVTVHGLGGLTLIPGANVWFNSGDDGSCTTDGGGVCSKEVDHSGEYRISASKEGYETVSDHYVTVEDEDVSTSVTLEKISDNESSEEPNVAEMTFSVAYEQDGYATVFPLEGATISLDEGDSGSCTTEQTTVRESSCVIEVDRSKSYLATVEADGFNTIEETISFEPDQTEMNIKMQPSGTRSASILNYNAILDCFSDQETPKACTPEKRKVADLNNDGKVNSADYNTFIYTFRL